MAFNRDSNQPLKIFNYVVVEKAPMYRAILRAFMDAKSRFALHLRPREILEAVSVDLFDVPPSSDSLTDVLNQLCAWGNLDSHPDTADVTTVEEFYRPRHLYQLTADGEAADRAIQFYEQTVHQPGELQTAALADIRVFLEELLTYRQAAESDDGKIHRVLIALRDRFEQLTSQAQIFIGGLQRTIDLHGFQLEALLAYKQKLIEYLERFIGELVISAADIATILRDIEKTGVESLLEIAARRDLIDRLDPSDADQQASKALWQARWAGLRAWFIGRPHESSQAEVLRARARAAIPALLAAVAGVNERRVARSDRAADLKMLALWFAECDNEQDAHRLWRAAFGLAPARHLRIDATTLTQREERPISPNTSWLHAPAIEISPRLRASGRSARPGRADGVIDRSAEKAELARTAELEAQQIAGAQRRLAAHDATRLSELGSLDEREFELFLDLLGEALSRQSKDASVVEATSTDGTLRIRLRPTADGRQATIPTSTGTLTGEDYYLSIRSAFGGEREQLEALLMNDQIPMTNDQFIP